MATSITFRNAEAVGSSSVLGKARVSEEITASGSNQTTSITALAGEVAHISTDVAIYVDVGQSPNATTGIRDKIEAGATKDIGRLASGDTVAISTA